MNASRLVSKRNNLKFSRTALFYPKQIRSPLCSIAQASPDLTSTRRLPISKIELFFTSSRTINIINKIYEEIIAPGLN